MSKRTAKSSADDNDNDDGSSHNSDSNTNADETKEQRKIRRTLKKIKKQKKQLKRETKRHKRNRSSNADDTQQLQSSSPTKQQQQITSLPLSQPLAALPSSSQSQSQDPSIITRNSNSNVNMNNDKECNPFERKKARLLVSLLPASLRNTNKAINGAMQSLLLRYSDGIGGVLLAFDNLQIEDENQKQNNNDDFLTTTPQQQQRTKNSSTTSNGRYGKILDEFPHIHYTITSNILVFSPTLHQKLTGVVNESFPSHIGILCYDFFNAMVSADFLRKGGFGFDCDLNEWSRVESGRVVRIEDEVVFTVEKIHECSGLISIEGSKPFIVGVGGGGV